MWAVVLVYHNFEGENMENVITQDMLTEIIQNMNATSGFQILQFILTIFSPFLGILIGYKISRSQGKRAFKKETHMEVLKESINYLANIRTLQTRIFDVKNSATHFLNCSEKELGLNTNDYYELRDKTKKIQNTMLAQITNPKQERILGGHIVDLHNFKFRDIVMAFEHSAGKYILFTEPEIKKQFQELIDKMRISMKQNMMGFDVKKYIDNISDFMTLLKKAILKHN